MTTKEIEIKTKKTVYVAQDGTEFNDPVECKKYDESALAILKARVKKLAIKVTNEDCIFSCGYENQEVWVIIPRTTNDISVIRQLLFIYGYSTEKTPGIDESLINRVLFLFENEDKTYMWYQTLDRLVSDAVGDLFTVREIINLEK